MRRILIVIATNSIGAGIIFLGAQLQNLPTAIATTAAGTVFSISGAAYAIRSGSMATLQAQQEALHWIKESRRHLQEKQELLIKFEELKDRIIEAEEQYETVSALLGLDDEVIQKLEQAELN